MASLVTMRHFIELSLYGPNGYFRKARPLIIDAPHALTSNSARQLNSAIGKLYRDSPQAEFATASSLFRESYAEAVGAWCRQRNVTTVVEVGAGSGALACSLLALNRDIKRYESVEISGELAAAQRRAASAAGVSARHRVCEQSFFDWQFVPQRDDGNVALLAFEVFDNLACDKLVVSPSGSAKQAWVETRPDGTRAEVYRDVSDARIAKCLKLWLDVHPAPADRPKGFVLWLPTAAFDFAERTKRLFDVDKLSLLIADFDALPPSRVVGTNAPTVQCNAIASGLADDTIETFHDVLRAPFGCVDIMFETSFEFLRRSFGARQLIVEKHSDFLLKFSRMPKATREYYPNFAVLRSE
jgi:hypothetical protein